MKSIRQNLLLWLTLGMLIAISIAGLSMYWLAQEEISELFDYQLKQVALSIQVQKDVITLESTDKELEKDNVIQVWNDQSVLIYNPKPSRALPRYNLLGLETVFYRNKAWRIFILQRNAQHIQVAQPIEERNEFAASLAARMLLPFLLLIPMLAGLIWVVVSRSLRPLQAVVSAVAKRHQTAMQPIDEIDLPLEIQPMVAALNQLLQRLNQAMQAQRAFIADAAHELRTPLTALKLQLQLTERANKDKLLIDGFSKLNERLNRSTHLVGQLLTLARSEKQAEPAPFVAVNLSNLVHQAEQDFLPLATANQIKLLLEIAPDVMVMGQPENLLILISNLVDNAIRYSARPSASKPNTVIIGLKQEFGQVQLSVSDNGAGIPAEDRERVLNRFYRREGTEATGSGLGLAIVHNIAKAHHAILKLSDNLKGSGLVVTVTFPAKSATVNK